ncbi:MAG TPA: TlpA disulfide reductase family protein [Chitinophagaceae bacterium]|nr:TlpA disulfide reductase family protein [Chitinophagaceae bacterium]
MQRRISFLLILILATLMNYAQNESAIKQYRMTVIIPNPIWNGKAFLRYFTSKGRHLDSAVFKSRKFEFRGEMPGEFIIAKLYLKEKTEENPTHENSCDIWLEPGEINVITKNNLMHAEFSGSENQKQFSGLQKNLLPSKIKGNELDEAYEKAVSNKDLAAKDILLNEEYPAQFKQTQQVLGEFISTHPSSLISAYKFDDFVGDGEINFAVVDPVYAMLDEKIKQNPKVKAVAERMAINKKILPGMDALPFEQTDTSGKKISLSSFHGKWLLIDFWAGWCIPCRAENPNLIKMYDHFNAKGFEILGVSLDGERERWTHAIIDDKLVWPQVSDLNVFDNTVAKLYGISSIPQNILINPEGKIVARNLRGSNLETKLSEILK